MLLTMSMQCIGECNSPSFLSAKDNKRCISVSIATGGLGGSFAGTKAEYPRIVFIATPARLDLISMFPPLFLCLNKENMYTIFL